ncbi:MAG TPA: glycosyltransferase [Alphaproteobacteria bacterium]|nr:glycosyltransferase [Alphaproteobacteria bacterium]
MADKKSDDTLRILVACRKFDGVVGGVERMSTTLMNELVKRGHEVFLFTWDEREDAKAFYPIDEKIKWTKLAMGDPTHKASLLLRLKRALKVRKILNSIRPDIVLGFQEGSFVTLKLYGLGLGIPMICAIRESPFRYAYIEAKPPFWFSCQIFRLAASVTVQFERYKAAFPKFLWPTIKVTPNHIFPAAELADTDGKSGERKILLSTGRLSPEKNHKILVEAFAKISDELPDWDLVIVGKGGQEEPLKKQTSALPESVAARIHLPGPTDDVPSWLKQAQLFCLPSKWEGFPNALAEAMAHGLPCVGFAECDGVRDLIDHGKTGILAAGNDDASTLAVTLRKLMESSELRRTMGQAGFEKTKSYSPEAMLDNWETVLREGAGR